MRALVVSVLIGAFVAVFLILFKPFDTSGSDLPQLNLFLAGYGVVIAVATFIPWLLLRFILPANVREEKWNVGRQILYLFGIVSFGITASYWYLLRAGGSANWLDYFYFFRNGLLVASFPIIVLTLLDYIRKLRYYESGAVRLNNRRMEEIPTVKTRNEYASVEQTHSLTVSLIDSQGRIELTTPANLIWCLHSDGNYVEVWTIGDNGNYERTLIRNTLSALTEQLPDQASFINCHRSWVVNADLVENITGNAQGYQLHRVGAPTVIVARGRSKKVLASLEKPG